MRFVVIASPRTGSTHLTSMLNEQEGIVCHGEIFHPKKVFVRWPKEQKSPEVLARLMELRQRDPQEFLDYVCNDKTGDRHVGFKIFAGHNDSVLHSLISDNSIRKIVLCRSNLLASHSSSLIGRNTSRGSKRIARPEPLKVHFDAAKFMAYCERYCAFYRRVFERLNAARQIFFVLHYEQINDPWFLASLVGFIGGDPEKFVARSRREKLNTSAILSRFSNSADAEEFLRLHNLAAWQHESSVSLDPFGRHTSDQREGS